ncbi:uncharacterized protein VTP21DRAFT_10100 [Calcarisporiella thermophila]|uniref:uncharacterized protein n=1 Tax=Calcarisporiella thermophila TaxID=911321 RepID=UPI0037437C63
MRCSISDKEDDLGYEYLNGNKIAKATSEGLGALFSQMEALEEALNAIRQNASLSPQCGTTISIQSRDNETLAEGGDRQSLRAEKEWCNSMNGMDCNFLMTGKELRFQARLSSLGDLLRLFRLHDIEVKSSPSIPLTTANSTALNGQPQGNSVKRCSILLRFDLGFQNSRKTSSLNRLSEGEGASLLPPKLADFLIHVYASDCFYMFQHPDRAGFLDRYYARAIPPALLHPALAWAAVHVTSTHFRSPYRRKMRKITAYLLEEARAALADAFDLPAEDTVLGLLTMCICESERDNNATAFKYLWHAVVMARVLQMDREQGKSAMAEVRRRIWYALCLCDILATVTGSMESLIPLEVISSSTPPRVVSDESAEAEFLLWNLVHGVGFLVQILDIPDLDFTMSDAEIINSLKRVSTLLQQRYDEGSRLAKEERFSPHPWISIILQTEFYSSWGQLWRRFLEAEVPPDRFDTPLMGELRSVALQESIKAVEGFSVGLRQVADLRSLCRLVQLDVHARDICRLHRCITKHHPDPLVRKRSAASLIGCLRKLRERSERDCGLIKRICRDLVEALEVMEPEMLILPKRAEDVQFRFKQIEF